MLCLCSPATTAIFGGNSNKQWSLAVSLAEPAERAARADTTTTCSRRARRTGARTRCGVPRVPLVARGRPDADGARHRPARPAPRPAARRPARGRRARTRRTRAPAPAPARRDAAALGAHDLRRALWRRRARARPPRALRPRPRRPLCAAPNSVLVRGACPTPTAPAVCVPPRSCSHLPCACALLLQSSRGCCCCDECCCCFWCCCNTCVVVNVAVAVALAACGGRCAHSTREGGHGRVSACARPRRGQRGSGREHAPSGASRALTAALTRACTVHLAL